MKYYLFIAVPVLLLTLTINANADISREVRTAQKLLAAGDYEKALEEYQRVAREKDNPLAKHTIAMFYDFGWGRKPDPVKACQWYVQAAQAYIPVAADAAARCFAEGIHGDVDYTKAAAWYQKAADLGHHSSLCSLGALYIEGNGVNKDAGKGLELCQQSAEQGSVPSMLRLAGFYMNVDEVRDYPAALHWVSTAASYQSVDAQFKLAVMLRDGLGTDRNPLEARSWFEKLASNGYRPAYFDTALLYYNAPANPETGLWYENDLAKAYMWLTATQQCIEDEAQLRQVSQMLATVREVMPKSWEKELDAKVTAHLEQYAADNAEIAAETDKANSAVLQQK